MKKSLKSGVVWITGLSGAGKTTFATALCKHLKLKYQNVILIDGDVFRGIIDDFGYERESRIKSAIQYNALIAFLEKNDLIIIAATISTFNEIYHLNRQNFRNYFEIYIHCDLQALIERDKNGLYSGALNGKIPNVVGVDIPYEEPARAHFVLENSTLDCLKEKTTLLCRKVDNFLNNLKN